MNERGVQFSVLGYSQRIRRKKKREGERKRDGKFCKNLKTRKQKHWMDIVNLHTMEAEKEE